MSGYETLLWERDGPVATITLRRPEKLNAISATMRRELLDALEACGGGHELRVVRLRGDGSSFCAGYDLSGYGEAQPGGAGQDRPPEPVAGSAPARGLDELGESRASVDVAALRRNLRWLVELREFRKPLVCQVHGYCLSGALDLMAVSDIVFAASDARIGHPAARGLGIPLSLGFLPERVGALRTKELLFTGDLISGEMAERWGLVNRCYPAEELDRRTMAFCRRIANVPADVLAIHKRAANLWLDLAGGPQAMAMNVELDAIAHLSPYHDEFFRVAAAGSLAEALRWRDAPFKEQDGEKR